MKRSLLVACVLLLAASPLVLAAEEQKEPKEAKHRFELPKLPKLPPREPKEPKEKKEKVPHPKLELPHLELPAVPIAPKHHVQVIRPEIEKTEVEPKPILKPELIKEAKTEVEPKPKLDVIIAREPATFNLHEPLEFKPHPQIEHISFIAPEKPEVEWEEKNVELKPFPKADPEPEPVHKPLHKPVTAAKEVEEKVEEKVKQVKPAGPAKTEPVEITPPKGGLGGLGARLRRPRQDKAEEEPVAGVRWNLFARRNAAAGAV